MSQIQVFDRTRPGLPLKKGRAGTMTHDYKRHGTTTLFAALNVLDGTVSGRNMQRPLRKRRLKRGVFRSIADLQAAINRVLDQHNGEATPFTWTADPSKIIAAVKRGNQASDLLH